MGASFPASALHAFAKCRVLLLSGAVGGFVGWVCTGRKGLERRHVDLETHSMLLQTCVVGNIDVPQPMPPVNLRG